MTRTRELSAAKRAKKDEFYTDLDDIAEEVKHYRDHFRGKVVLCNCDDPRVSNFFHYFSHNMEADHVTPWSKGGHTVAANCQLLCRACNRRKSDK